MRNLDTVSTLRTHTDVQVMADGDGTLSCASGSVFEVDSAQPANHLEVSSGSVQKRGVQANATGQQPRVDGNTPVYGETEDEREERQRLEVKERMKRMLHKVRVSFQGSDTVAAFCGLLLVSRYIGTRVP